MTKLRLVGSVRALAAGTTEMEVSAGNFGELIAELDRRFPGLGRHVEEEMAICIDGVIWQDAYDAPIASSSEVLLLPKIKGG
jgi:molybdopterin converting factor small subunit